MKKGLDVSSGEVLDNLTETKLEPWMKLTGEGWDVPVGEIRELEAEINGLKTDFKVYYPINRTEKMPMLYFIHGGAHVGGFNVMDEPVCRKVCNEVGIVVVSPNYGLAPQYKFPSAIEQLYGLLKYIISDKENFGIDPERIAVGGSSAGANYAAALCIMAYERKDVSFKYQVSVYPDVEMSDDLAKYQAAAEVGAQDSFGEVNMEHPTIFKNMFDQYVPEGTDVKNPLVSPLYGPVEAFPKTCIFSGREDLLWYDGHAFADKLSRGGVEVLYKSYAHIGHGFMELAGAEHISRDVKNIICAELKRNL